MSSARAFDVAVVGGSVAGSSAARLFAQAGARVALIERRHDPSAYKVVCTHVISPIATPVLERLGLAQRLKERGAVRRAAEFWTPYGGWFAPPEDAPQPWGVTRRTLDPMLRDLAIQTPGVEYFGGWTAKRILLDGSRPSGIEVEDRSHRRVQIRTRLVVGADGRGSTLARLAGVRGRIRQHNRFFYFAYWRGVGEANSPFRLWILDPDAAAQFPNEDEITLLVATYHRSRLAEVQADLDGAYMHHLRSLPDAPDLSNGERISKLIGKLELPNVIRPAATPGLAFVGDAALATDPLWAVGISIGLQSAEWLVDETSDVIDDRDALDNALRRYRRKFAWRLGPLQLYIADLASGRRLSRLERLIFSEAATEPEVARTFVEVLSRERSPLRMFHPRIAGRLLRTRSASATATSAQSNPRRATSDERASVPA